jgi:hypothetical protein
MLEMRWREAKHVTTNNTGNPARIRYGWASCQNLSSHTRRRSVLGKNRANPEHQV